MNGAKQFVPMVTSVREPEIGVNIKSGLATPSSPAAPIVSAAFDGASVRREAFQTAAMNPLQFWMQFAEQCQKSWSETMFFWSKAGKLH